MVKKQISCLIVKLQILHCAAFCYGWLVLQSTLLLMQFSNVFLALPLLQKNLGTAPFSQHLRINPRVGLIGILLSWVEEGFSAGLFHTRKSREGPRTEQDLEILKVLGPLVPGSKDPEGQGIKSSRT